MPSRVPPIARIRLARSTPRLLVLPLLLVALGLVAALGAWLGPMRAMEPAWLGMVGAGLVLVVVGVVLAVWLVSIRLDVEEAAVRIHWLGGERLHPLVPGPVTRVRLRGENASSLRSRTGFLGWMVGPARLRGEEDVRVVRLARTPSAILVPTEGGRLAIAPAVEQDLIDALSRAARARQRLEELARVAPPSPPVEAPAPPAEPEPHVLTGIERAEMESRLARNGTELSEPRMAPAAAAEAGAVANTRDQAARTAPGRGVRFGRPRPSVSFVLLPLLGSGAVWAAALLLGRLPDGTTELGRLTSLGLVLAGPATSVGAIMARAWWPRLVGVVVTSGLAATVFVGRAVLGS